MEKFSLGGKLFNSRLFLGTGKFSSPEIMREAVIASGSELITVALKRVRRGNSNDPLVEALQIEGVSLLPNTSGARDAKEAVFAAMLAREALNTNWIKLEIHPDPRYLMPDPIETFKAADELVKRGFIVLPYVHADPSLCKRLENCGVAAVMPLAAPIGSNAGLTMRHMLEIIINESLVPVIIDAGLGSPSDAALAMEIGASAVLVNTAIAVSDNPVKMASAFKKGVQSGREAFEARLAPKTSLAEASSPLTSFLEAV